MRKDVLKRDRALASPRDGKGRFKRGHTGNPNGRPPLVRGDLAEMIATTISTSKLARQLIRLAYSGDPRALDRVCSMVDRLPERNSGTAIDYSLLSQQELIAWRALLNKSQRQPLDREDIAMLAKIAAPAIRADEEIGKVGPEEEVAADYPAAVSRDLRIVRQPQ